MKTLLVLILVIVVFALLRDPSPSPSSSRPAAAPPPAPAARTFVERDFYWDDTTTPHKDIIIAGVNKVAKENSQCRQIDPSSAYVSSSRGTPDNPVFYVTCGSGATTHNVFFSKWDVEADARLAAPVHIERARAMRLCQDEARSVAANPETVEFSVIVDLAYTDFPNGNTRILSTFTAEDAFGQAQEFNINCLFNASGLIESSVSGI